MADGGDPAAAAGHDGGDTRQRLLDAALGCFERNGLAATSLEDVARQAGMSRATVYRHFPGGREQLVSETVQWEVVRFLRRMAVAVDDQPDLAGRLTEGLVFGHRAIHDHALLQQVLRTEPDVILKELIDTGPIMFAVVRDEVRRRLDDERLAPGVDIDEAADYVTRMFLSYLGSHGSWDLSDPAAVARLVRTHLLAGVVAPA